MNRNKLTLGAAAFGAAAALALGQNAGNDSAGPTRNDYRLQLVEPAEGATVTGSTVRIVVNTEIPSDMGETRRDVNSMPRPDVDVFLDDQNRGSMRDANNVLTLDGVPVGDHTIILLAKNRANEIIGRKVVHFSSTAALMASAPASDSTLVPVSYRAPDPAPAAPPSTQVAALAPMPQAAAQTSTQADLPAPKGLPKTATLDPLLLTAGALLVLGGLGLRRIA